MRTSTQLAQDGPSAGMTSRPEDVSRSPAVWGAEAALPPSLMTSRTCRCAPLFARLQCQEGLCLTETCPAM